MKYHTINFKPSINKNTYDYKIIFYNFYGSESIWTHNAVEAGDYLSIHTRNHFHPPETDEFKDPDDLSTKLLELWKFSLKPMIYSDMMFGDKNQELKEYKYDAVEVPVTKQEFEEVQAIIRNQIQRGQNGQDKYSVFSFLGISCAKSPQTILKTITKDSDESVLTKCSFLQNIIAWPQSNYDKAVNLAEARNKGFQLTNHHLFAKTVPKQKPTTIIANETIMKRYSVF